ncbi:MAG: flavoprotein [Daejeonella sp.]|nr:flavoprotein [Daejeonella sp.]
MDADSILICTPKYAMGVPELKNALDSTASSMDFSEKPFGLIIASLSGKQAALYSNLFAQEKGGKGFSFQPLTYLQMQVS